MARLRKAKEDYLAAHPEEAEAIVARDKAAQAAKQEKDKGNATVNIMGARISFREKKQAELQGLRFDRQGRLLNPYACSVFPYDVHGLWLTLPLDLRSEKSLYFDPVFNPYGAPPPGLPYRARRKSLQHKLRVCPN